MWIGRLISGSRLGRPVLVVVAFLALSGAVSLLGTAAIERAYPATGQFVPVTGGRLHVVEKAPPGGATDKPPVVLIHGAAANLHDPDSALGDRLSQRYRVLLIDRPGHGWSSPGIGPDAATPAGEAALVREALQRLGVTSFVLVGHSWGGALAAAYGLDYPQDLAGLILLAPAVYPWPGSTTWYHQLGSTPVIGPVFAYLFALPVGALLTPYVLNLVFSPDPPPADYMSRASAWLALRPAEFLVNAREVTGLNAALARQAARYHQLKVPTIIITGTADAVVPSSLQARPLAAALPDASLELLRGVGHMPHYADPDRVVDAVAEFADGVAKVKAAPQRAH